MFGSDSGARLPQMSVNAVMIVASQAGSVHLFTYWEILDSRSLMLPPFACTL